MDSIHHTRSEIKRILKHIKSKKIMTLVKFGRGYETIEGKYYPYYIIEGKNYYESQQGKQVVFDNEQDVIEYLEEE